MVVVPPKNPLPARFMVDMTGAAAIVVGIALLDPNADISLVILSLCGRGVDEHRGEPRAKGVHLIRMYTHTKEIYLGNHLGELILVNISGK
jgi:hypothetical protein